jgi:hypothetical protein
LRARPGSSRKSAPGGEEEAAARGKRRKGDSMAMAHHDNDDELLRSRVEGWRGFAHLLGWVITGAVIVLALMALFLV